MHVTHCTFLFTRLKLNYSVRCVTSVMVCTVVDNVHPTSVATPTVFATTVSTAGLLFTRHLACRIIVALKKMAIIPRAINFNPSQARLSLPKLNTHVVL